MKLYLPEHRSVAKRFGLSESAVYRHKNEHLPAHLLKAREVEEEARADELLDQVRNLQVHALDILERAEKAGDLRTALAAISQARGNLELLGKLAGELDDRPVENLNVSPEWLELRAMIVGALEPYGEAKEAMVLRRSSPAWIGRLRQGDRGHSVSSCLRPIAPTRSDRRRAPEARPADLGASVGRGAGDDHRAGDGRGARREARCTPRRHRCLM
jgi:hypothetical protein